MQPHNFRLVALFFGMTTIRHASPPDAESLAHLAERTFRETFTAANDSADMELHCAKNFATDIQRREILDPNYITLVAERDAELVAFAQVRLNSFKECVSAERPLELYRIYVSAEWHGQGIAQSIMSEVLAAAASKGADCIWLGVWENNSKALAFYRKFRFEVVGDHIFQMGSDPQRDLIMALEMESRPE